MDLLDMLLIFAMNPNAAIALCYLPFVLYRARLLCLPVFQQDERLQLTRKYPLDLLPKNPRFVSIITNA
ncbi:hypothetical protein GDO78_022887 [Eleutherodactylus coqui]|uniref:Uncharacterized protein n=1 Tax=Eleutherodactylus coqui TaxID=57060 RepID=A0A8J6EFU1_ELECQ|nr:hypothetical protein GDO78_022887 [Eleutherodactylus coqui]